jgi:hypothetical protein
MLRIGPELTIIFAFTFFWDKTIIYVQYCRLNFKYSLKYLVRDYSSTIEPFRMTNISKFFVCYFLPLENNQYIRLAFEILVQAESSRQM